MTFDEWIESVRGDDEKAIPATDPIFDFADDIGLPNDFLYLGWRAFCEQHRSTSKRQRDWRQTFRNYVKNPMWLGVWYIDRASGEYRLTTKGLQLQRELETRERLAA